MAKTKKVSKSEKSEKSEKKSKKGTNYNLHDFAKGIAEENEDVTVGAAHTVLKSFFTSLHETVVESKLVPGDSVTMPGFGKLVCIMRKPRNARNPKTGEKLKIPERPAVKFKMAAQLRIWGKPAKEEKPSKKAGKAKKSKSEE